MTSFKDFLEEQLLDEEFAEHYDEVSAEMDLALAIVLRREKLGLTQQALADLMEMKQPMLARIEGGQMPSPRTLQRLAKALKVGVFFTGDGIMLVPWAGSRVVAAHAQPSPHAARQEWEFPIHKVERKRQRIECDYALLAQMVEAPKIAGSRRPKEKANASLEIAA